MECSVCHRKSEELSDMVISSEDATTFVPFKNLCPECLSKAWKEWDETQNSGIEYQIPDEG